MANNDPKPVERVILDALNRATQQAREETGFEPSSGALGRALLDDLQAESYEVLAPPQVPAWLVPRTVTLEDGSKLDCYVPGTRSKPELP